MFVDIIGHAGGTMVSPSSDQRLRNGECFVNLFIDVESTHRRAAATISVIEGAGGDSVK